MRIVQINSSANVGSTGRIMEDIGRLLIMKGHDSFCVYGRGSNGSESKLIRVGNRTDQLFHVAQSRIADRHGFGSLTSTKTVVGKIRDINPDIIHLHNIHGYFLNIEVLFEFLKERNKPVIWTFHDCWPFTGHCSYFDAVNCFNWQSECHNCPNLKGYPASWLIDNSKNNFYRKKAIFTGHNNLTIVTPSQWLASHLTKSFLSEYPMRIIPNGIDLSVFSSNDHYSAIRRYKIPSQDYVLGIARIWDKRKGLADFIKLREQLPPSINITLVGLNRHQISGLPEGITGIVRTEKIQDLAALYSAALVFVNPTYVDNFPTTNIEALACGTPVITYNTGGSPEAIDIQTGFVVEKGDIKGLTECVLAIKDTGKDQYSYFCRSRAEKLYGKNERYGDYMQLYSNLLNKGQK